MRRAALVVAAALLFIAPHSRGDKPLTRAEQKERIAALGDTYREFLLDVAPIITDAEKQAFLRLESDPQRDMFIDDFWLRRDKKRGTNRDSFRKDFYERLEVVKDKYESTTSDRGKTYLIFGEPAEAVQINCQSALRPIEVWVYSRFWDFPDFGQTPILLFFQPQYQRTFKLWDPIADGWQALTATDPIYRGSTSAGSIDTCKDIEYVFAAMKWTRDHPQTYLLFEPPKFDPESVSRIVKSVVIANPSAPKIEPRVRVTYPAAEGLKTGVQFALDIPRKQVQAAEVSQVKVYSLEVIGEVTREGKMWETFRYTFDFPPDTAGETLPVVIDRMLREGPYVARIKVVDPKSGGEAIVEQALDVPGPGKVSHPDNALLDTLKQNLVDDRATVRIVPLPDDDVVSGVQRIETILTGKLATGVEFWLDNRKIAVRHAPPFQLDVDFGNVPQTHKVRVVAVDDHDNPITGDEISVNTGTEPFRVRIAQPRVAPKLEGATRVAVDVKTPRGKKVKQVDLFYNDVHVVTMTDPPFVQTVNVASANQIGYIRAMATLNDDAQSTAEDAVIINSPAQMETVDVHLVELPTTVTSSGRRRLGLPQSAFRVYDEAKRVDIAKFEEVKNLPLSIGIAVDNSASMEPRIASAQKAAADFLKTTMRTGDKAFVVAFDSTPRVLQPWSAQSAELFTALAKMQARDQTALYDAIVYSLYNFTGVRGQRALIIVTDGKDTSSRFTYEQALEYAHRSGVPVYAIGIGIRDLDLSTRNNLSRIAAETGGDAFFIDPTTNLSEAYAEIADQLRSQYIIGFYPPEKSGTKWHEVSVQVDGGKAKTVRGYYP